MSAFSRRGRVPPRGAGAVDKWPAGARRDPPNAHICVFDVDPATGDRNSGATGVVGAKDISPVRTEMFIRVDPDLLARHAFSQVPAEMLGTLADGDLIRASIRARLAKWWPELAAGKSER